MIAQRARRRRRSRVQRRAHTARRRIRPLLGAAIVVAGMVVPLDSTTLPDPLGDAVGESPVLAQSQETIEGYPNQCSASPWPSIPMLPSPEGSECVLEVAACPESPLRADPAQRGELLIPSTQQPTLVDADAYPGFCEIRFLRPQDPPPGQQLSSDDQTRKQHYDDCMSGVGGFVNISHRRTVTVTVIENNVPVQRDVDELRCRLLHPATCPAGLSQASSAGFHRTGTNSCKAFERRTWTCPSGYAHRNEYLLCYKAPAPLGPGQNLACLDGSPDFVALDCAEYVGTDFTRSPNLVDCETDFPTGDPDPNIKLRDNSNRGLPSSAYWCEFDSSFLKIVCHGSSPPTAECTPTPALCLKRASETGGCNGIANTIRCRGLQEEYQVLLDRRAKGRATDSDVRRTAEEIRDEGCEPCLLLPFRSVPQSCPDDLAGDLTPVSSSVAARLAAIHTVKRDLSLTDCVNAFTGVINNSAACSAARVCADPPRGRLSWSSSHYSQLAVVNSPVVLTVGEIPAEYHRLVSPGYRIGIYINSISYLKFSDSGGPNPDPVVRLWPELGTQSFQSVTDLMRNFSGQNGECIFNQGTFIAPAFKVIVKELWPDTDEQAIRDLFGDSALNWWTNLSTEERRARNGDRGFELWSDLTNDHDRDQESNKRADVLVREIDCNYGTLIWCRWSPTRPGYYQLTAAGAWRSSKSNGGRSWRDSTYLSELETYLQGLDPFDGNCDSRQFPIADRDCLQNLLNDRNVKAAQLGLTATLDGVEPLLPGVTGESMYTASGGIQCPSVDLRVSCGGSGDSGNYTVSEPIGIMVHEVRVATRTPNS